MTTKSGKVISPKSDSLVLGSGGLHSHADHKLVLWCTECGKPIYVFPSGIIPGICKECKQGLLYMGEIPKDSFFDPPNSLIRKFRVVHV